MRLLIRLIRHGVEDEKIKTEYYKVQCKCKCGGNCFSGIFDKIISALFCVLFIGVFLFSLGLSLSEEKMVGDVPVMRVVQSGSMSKKYEKNTYLFDNDLNDQIQTFDIIVTEKLPDEKDLKLYDIVVYEVDDTLVVHRIVKIEEPNKTHPDCRWFTLQGDNVQYPDKTPVLYSQMIAIYNGVRIPYIGSFVSFMQSPAGYLCILLIVFGTIAIPVVEKILEKEREKRLIAIGELPSEGERLSEWQPPKKEEVPTIKVEPVLAIENAPAQKVEKPSAPKVIEVEKPTPKPTVKSVPAPTRVKVESELVKKVKGGFVSQEKPTTKESSKRSTCDWFYDTLTAEEKGEFIKLFVFKELGGVSKLPAYVIGGNNYVFFRCFFMSINAYRGRISENLLNKMEQYCIKKF
ncbi:MAG: hypothetical protein E7343_00960 [Clostridiales bacterium]|nr:hypothetical protein [Clostridiales bacterium]